MNRASRYRFYALLAAGLLFAAAAGTGIHRNAAAAPAPPQPVYVAAPNVNNGQAADPGVVRDGNDYVMFMTGGRGRVARANTPQGPWTALPDALSRLAAWESGVGAVWAPAAAHTSAGWVLYYNAPAAGFAGQRCVGTAVSDNAAGPYEPSDTPLVCPILGGEDPLADRPVASAGVIDADPFQAGDGQRYLVYRTQKTPSSIRIFPLSADGLHGAGQVSRELVRSAGTIEAPVMVQQGDEYVLFASIDSFQTCKYTTVWFRSTDIFSFADKTENVLLDQANTGLCGPGGADVVLGPGGPNVIVLHGWMCAPDEQPCQSTGTITDPTRQRVIYAAVLTWGDDGITPTVPAFLPPVG